MTANKDMKQDQQTGNKPDAMARLLEVMAQLRDPNQGCPWDIKQDFKSIAPYTIEEAYEVADAIEQNDMAELKHELGDLLFQVVYHAQMAEERNLFGFYDVVEAVTNKMICRHPHVFGAQEAHSPQDVDVIWEAQKDKEAKRQAAQSLLDDVPRALPALKRGQKLQKRAARVGFEWDDAVDVLDKMEEEIAEMRAALAEGKQEEIRDELGDLFFVLTNFGRMLGLDCETAMEQTNRKFIRRFQAIEKGLAAQGKSFDATTLEEMEALWQAAKQAE